MPLALCLVACSALTDPGPEDDAVLERYPPFEVYTEWWDELQACAGEAGDLDRVRFHVVLAPLGVSGRQFVCGPGTRECAGRWIPPHDILLGPGFLLSEVIVKHEMLHDLLQTTGHPDAFGACAIEEAEPIRTAAR